MGRDEGTGKDGSGKDPMLRAYARYGALGIQMAALMVGGILAGHWLDQWIGWDFPLLTLVLSFAGLGAAIWMLFRETRKPF